MKDLFVPYKLALLAKEKGYTPGKAAAYQTQEYNRLVEFWYNKRDFEIAPHLLAAPLYQQLVDWFRNKHEIIVGVQLEGNSFKQNYVPFHIKGLNPNNTKYLNAGNENYYEALTTALTETFKLI